MPADILSSFCASFKTGELPGSQFSPQVAEDLRKDRQELMAEGVMLDIEPIGAMKEVGETRSSGERIVKFSGSFIYGFVKNGLFYETYNDYSVPVARTVTEQGDIVFLLDAQGVVQGVEIVFSGNPYGKPVPHIGAYGPARFLRLFLVVGIIVFVGGFFIMKSLEGR